MLNLPGIVDHPFYVHGPEDRYVSECLLNTGRMEPLETRIFLDLIPYAQGVLDIGSNLGYYAVIAGLVGSAGVPIIAVEPDPCNAALLRRNIAQHPRTKKVVVIEAAVSDRTGQADLHLSQDNFGDHRIAPEIYMPRKTVAVKTLTLNKLLAQYPEVDLIKLDTQGAEPLILLPAFDALWARRDRLTLVLEFWPEVISAETAKSLLDQLDCLELSLFDLNEDAGRVTSVTSADVLAYHDQSVRGMEQRPFTNLLATSRKDVAKMIEQTFLRY